MRGGVILIVVALLVGYVGVTGKYKCFTNAFACLLGDEDPCNCKGGTSTIGQVKPTSGFPSIAPLTPLRPIGGGLFGSGADPNNPFIFS